MGSRLCVTLGAPILATGKPWPKVSYQAHGCLCQEASVRPAAVRDEVRLGADQIKLQFDGGAGSPAAPIHTLQYSMEEFRTAFEDAKNAHTFVLSQAYAAASVSGAVDAGIRSITAIYLTSARQT